MALVCASVASTGCFWPNVTVAPDTARPLASSTRKVVTPVSWIPDPLRPRAAGAEAVAVTEAAGPAGPTTIGPASVPPDGGPASVPVEDGPCSVTRVPFATVDQLAVTTTLPAPQRAGSIAKLQA